LSWGIRRMLQIPRRYTIPLIVSTGTAYVGDTVTTTTKNTNTSPAVTDSDKDDAGLTHGNTQKTKSPRYEPSQVIYHNEFGVGM
jgi:hypothetical protein